MSFLRQIFDRVARWDADPRAPLPIDRSQPRGYSTRQHADAQADGRWEVAADDPMAAAVREAVEPMSCPSMDSGAHFRGCV